MVQVDREELRRMGQDGRYVPTYKVQEKLDMGHFTHDVLEKTLINGIQAKTEPDEKTAGKHQKITLLWKNWYLVVKDSDPCLIITAGERD